MAFWVSGSSHSSTTNSIYDEETETARFLHDFKNTNELGPSVTKPKKYIVWCSAANLLFLAVNLTAFIFNLMGQPASLNPTDNASYSPPIDLAHISTLLARINGTLFPPENPSIGRQKPNKEADTIWDEIELARTIPISSSDVLKLGKDPATVGKFEDSYWHLGDDAYMAQLDTFHQLHCLNTLRKLAYPEYYPQNKTYPLWYIHHDHCVDILMQHLMCNANTALYTMNWIKIQEWPFPDFSINRQCGDFDGLVKWRKENSVDMDKWLNMKKPAGVKQVPVPEMYWEIFGKPGDNA